MPAKASHAQKVDCRVERKFMHEYDQTIGSHDFYTVQEDTDERREIVHADACAYVNGVYDKRMSSKKYCKNP